MILSEKDKKRFFSKIKILENGCHLWTGAITGAGYGNFWDGMFQQPAHRVAFFIKHGKLNHKLQIDHICASRSCVNPAHLREVSLRTNVLSGKGLTAINNKKTSCKNGHEFTKENTHIRQRGNRIGRRECKICMDISNKKYLGKTNVHTNII
jgi:hypothetical protein